MSVDHFLKALILQGDSHCLYYVRRARKESNCETTELSAGKNSYCETMRWGKNEGRLRLKLI